MSLKSRNWGNSEYNKHVRIKADKHVLLNMRRGKKTIAGKLDEILSEWESGLVPYGEDDDNNEKIVI